MATLNKKKYLTSGKIKQQDNRLASMRNIVCQVVKLAEFLALLRGGINIQHISGK
ncbi:MAG: hypothetical protein SWX82_05695 [Cyanobacteriota bacterium]|nr:hypothetical protein [Cyanobacteriota bacterium]